MVLWNYLLYIFFNKEKLKNEVSKRLEHSLTGQKQSKFSWLIFTKLQFLEKLSS